MALEGCSRLVFVSKNHCWSVCILLYLTICAVCRGTSTTAGQTRARRAGGHGCPGLASTQRSTSHTRQPSATPSSLPTAPAACAVPRAPATCAIRSLSDRIQSSNGRIQSLTVKIRKLLDKSTLSYRYCLSQWRRINRLLNSICELNSRDYG